MCTWKKWNSIPFPSTYIIFNDLSWCGGRSSFPSIRSVVHPVIHPSKAKRGGRVRALLKLQKSTISENCSFCPIYSTIGIHPITKGYWPIIKFQAGTKEGSMCKQCSQFFVFFWFWGEGERENFLIFSIGGGGPVIHPWNGGDNHVAIYLIIRR
jgi:hypothetical protein